PALLVVDRDDDRDLAGPVGGPFQSGGRRAGYVVHERGSIAAAAADRQASAIVEKSDREWTERRDRRRGREGARAFRALDLARRLGLKVSGIGFPGHFLVKWDGPEEIVVDPFHGAVVGEEDCKRLLERLSGGKVGFRRELLTALPTRGILLRMLANLKGVWMR